MKAEDRLMISVCRRAKHRAHTVQVVEEHMDTFTLMLMDDRVWARSVKSVFSIQSQLIHSC